jgi:hypothetical protein
VVFVGEVFDGLDDLRVESGVIPTAFFDRGIDDPF